MKDKVFRAVSPVLTTVKYILAIFMIIAGVATMCSPITPLDGALGFIYTHRLALIGIGLVFSGSGLGLLIGKLTKNKCLTGRSLMAIFCCFLFASLLQGQAYGWGFHAWIPNAIAAVLVGLLWLWWRFKTHYINVHDFRNQAIQINRYHKLD